MSGSAEFGGAAGLVADFANAVCQAPSAAATDIARMLSLDLSTARHVGRQRIFPAAAPAAHIQFVLGPNDRTVMFVELVTVAPVSLAELTARFGPGREAPRDAYLTEPTVLFDGVAPPDAARTCSVLARPAPEGSDATPNNLRRFIFYLPPGR
jgi:hypothetical protein